MQLRTRTWALISVACFIGAAWFWQLGERQVQRRSSSVEAPGQEPGSAPAQQADVTPLTPESAAPDQPVPGTNAAASADSPLGWRLSNTDLPLQTLMQKEEALLLRNASIDTSRPLPLNIPEHLRAPAEPGSYVVQARGPLDDAFRTQLALVGARVVSYIPNNAYLVELSAAGADRMSAWGGTQSVTPWEPYFKLEPELLKLALRQEALRPGTLLNLLVYEGHRETAGPALAQVGVELLVDQRSPFGRHWTVRAPADSLVALARHPAVQQIELFRERVPANDLTRARIEVSEDTIVPDNYLDLTGAGVLVSVNDTGVDASHPDLLRRVTGDTAGITLADPRGHGTHVAGIIASSGANGPMGQDVPGSTNGAVYRGMAPMSEIFAMSLNRPDEYLQETAALQGALISHNSWAISGSRLYDFSAASWDAAVRDALPEVIGSQPLLAVFAAGNDGRGDGDGEGGLANTINSPATAKNVISVGSIEQFRNITNEVVEDMETNAVFLSSSDSTNQVSAFSSRGNVATGIEGPGGRFKPDVVAPGDWVVSTRSRDWTGVGADLTSIVNTIENEEIAANTTNLYALFIPDDARSLRIQTLSNSFSGRAFPILPIHARLDFEPESVDFVGTNDVTIPVNPGRWFYSIANTNADPIELDIRTTIVVTNTANERVQLLADLNDLLAPYYRFESGTSMSAAAVSGMLALMQQYFEQNLGITNSPALMKALLINGARTASSRYNFQTEPVINLQGWGLVNLTNSLPISLGADPIRFFDQETNALVTGQSQTRFVTVSSNSIGALRMTLVWTDPPGNPGSGIKLVNDLDLIVTNLATGLVYVGNNIRSASVFNSTSPTNAPLITDVVNNVENVYLSPPLGDSYSVTVRARRVNVNSVTAHPDGVAQDYALVISHGTNNVEVSDQPPPREIDPTPFVLGVTNGVPVLRQRVGANTPLLVSTNGITNQWNFYIFDNAAITNGVFATNVAFVTFLPPNLSRPRFDEADIDLYVSTEPGLTNLEPAVINSAWKSTGRGGTESVVRTDATPDQRYYVGVKSEDQQGATFGFFAIASIEPFSSRDEEGNLILRGTPAPMEIPDGSPQDPGEAIMFAFATEDIIVENIVVTNIVFHELGGDLLGVLNHNSIDVVLNNHREFQGLAGFIYDESDSGEILESQVADGPGSLRDFVGEQGIGVWQFSMVDNSLQHTGVVQTVTLKLVPRAEETNGVINITTTILPNRFFFTVVDVPADATNLMVCAGVDDGPVELYIRREAFPDRVDFDAFAAVTPPGGCLNLSINDSPPLSQGRYFIGVFNPNFDPVTVNLSIRVQRDLDRRFDTRFRADGELGLLDDARTNSTLFVPNDNIIADVKVGVRLDHDRLSDLALHLVSPAGTRLLLAENRGRLEAGNYGTGIFVTNVFPATSSGGAMADTNVITATLNQGTVIINYEFFRVPDQLQVYYEGNLLFDSGIISGAGTFSIDYGPGSSTNVTIVMNPGNNTDLGTLWTYQASIVSGGFFYTTFTDDTRLAGVPIKFAPPPFALTNTSFTDLAVIPISDFEPPSAGTYVPGSAVDGWDVLQQPVSVINSPGEAAGGDQYLALIDGRIQRLLPTQAGRPYRLTYSRRNQCIVGWWDAEGNARNKIGGEVGLALGVTYTDATNGFVNRAFDFNTGVAPSVRTMATPALDVGLGSGFTVELWINPATLASSPLVAWSDGANDGVQLWHSGPARQGGPGSLYANVRDISGTDNVLGTGAAGPVVTNQWQHIALTYDRGQTLLYYNGAVVASSSFTGVTPQTSFPLFLGGLPSQGAFFRGLMDEVSVYSCALSQAEIEAIHRAGDAGKANALRDLPAALLDVNGDLREVLPGPSWESTSFLFYSPLNTSLLELTGLSPLSVLVDEFELSEALGDVYYQPEEPLTPFRGENAFGVWSLEIWDSRVGGAVTNMDLISWELQFTFVNTNPPAILLTNGECFTGMLSGDQRRFFQVQVPVNAGSVTNTLTGSSTNLNLVFNQGALPFTNTAGNIDLFLSETGKVVITPQGTFMTDSNGILAGVGMPPALVPGQRYYLALQNTDPTETNDFTLCIDFGLPPPDPSMVMQLTNGVPVTNMITAPVSGSAGLALAPPGGQLQYYEFVASPSAVVVIFELLGPDGNVDLFVRQGLPLPNTISFDFASRRSGTNDEYIAVTNYNPGALAGSWYIGVANFESSTVTYAVVAREIAFDCLPLTNGLAYMPPAPVEPGGTHYYCYNVSTAAFGADFELFPDDGNVDLFIRRGIPPVISPTTFHYSGQEMGLTNEFIRVTNTARQNPLRAGDWYLAVVNQDATPVNYNVRVTEDTNLPPNIVCLTNAAPYANSVPVEGLDFYKFTVSPGALQANFELLEMTGNADLYLSRESLPSVGSAFYDSINPGPEDDWVVLTVDSRRPLAPGDWFLLVANNDTNAVDYAVRVTEFVPFTPELIVLTNRLTVTNTVFTNSLLTRAQDFYQFNVPVGAVQADFEILIGSGDVDLYLTRTVPLPGPTNFTYAATASGATEFIRVTNTAPQNPLTPGDWLISVVNNTLLAVDYEVRATVWSVGQEITRLTNRVAYSNTVDVPGVLGGEGIDYYVFGVSSNGVQAVFETFEATGNVDLFLRRGAPLPGPAAFDVASANGGLTNEFILLITNGIPVALEQGDWFLAVVNREASPVSYQVRASEVQIGTDIIPLRSFLVVSNCLDAADGILDTEIDYYSFDVSTDALQWFVETVDVASTGDADVFIGKGLPLPDAGMFDAASTNFGTSDELIQLTTNSLPLALTPGAWYIAVQNKDTNDTACYMIRAVEVRASRITTLTNAIPYRGLVGPAEAPTGVQYYRFDVSSNAVEAAFETFDALGNVDLFIGQGLPLPDATTFDHSSANSGLADELIVLSPATPGLLLLPGEWYMAVVNRDPTNVFFSVLATQIIPQTELITLTNTLAYSNTVSAAGGSAIAAVDYYVYTVSSNAVRAEFEVLNPTDDVDLFVRKGLPLPGPANFDLASLNSGTADEFILIQDSSQPVMLTPGDWYLAVVNRAMAPVGYTVRASEFSTTTTNVVILGWELTDSSFCIIWASEPGTEYYVEAKTSLLSPAWIAISPTIVANSVTTTFCVDLPSPYTLFEVRVGSSPLAGVGIGGSMMTTNGFLLQWMGSTNAQYGVDWTPYVPTNAWNTFSDVLTSTNGLFQFLDDGSQTGGLDSQRFYRVFER